MRVISELRSHIQYKIIIPFLVLTLLVALSGSAVSYFLIAGSAQERLNNQLAQVARATGDSVVGLENANLQFLREAAFAGENNAINAPAVAVALENNDDTGLRRALEPYFLVSKLRQGVRADRMIAFDTAGHSVVDWEFASAQIDDSSRVEHEPRDINALWFVPKVLADAGDASGDKFAGLLDLGDNAGRYLFTAAPVVRINDGKVVGGLLIATRLDTLLQGLASDASSAIVTLYRPDDGHAFASTQIPAAGLSQLNIAAPQVGTILNAKEAEQRGIFNTVAVNERAYQLAYVPLRIRGETVSILSVALAADYVVGPWADARAPLTTLVVVLMLAIIGLGVFVARQITRPLKELVDTAQAVTGGDLQRRSVVRADDEIGLLSGSFNNMTQHLTELYGTVRAEAGQRAAIVESITDGVLVCNPQGDILVINRATRALLGLGDDAPAPRRFEQVPLHALTETALAFGEARTPDLFQLNGHIVRVAAAPVTADDGVQLGDVYVLQDLTSEVAIDRAKTNFIATISHELRTPLTVLGGSSELLLRGLVGELNDDQRQLIDSMRKHTLTMTSLLNNVITIAGLESGTLTFAIEPIDAQRILDDLLWSFRPSLTNKGLQLTVDLSSDLPYVLADAQQLRTVLHQLLDNARRYTNAGGITVRAARDKDKIRFDISDTGCGISQELSERLFTRFTRGSEGINSAERGIGLGLTIAKLLLERQGGEIWLEQTSEHGSTFSFTLPSIDADRTTNNTSAFANAA